MENKMHIQELNSSKDTLQLLLDEAIELHQKNQFTEAEEKLEQVLHQDPDHLPALMRIAHVARSKGNRKLALSRFEQVIDKYPQHWIAYIDAAIELRTLKCFIKAEQMLSKVIKEVPNHLGALKQLADLSRIQNNRYLALKRYQKITEKHPQHWVAYIDCAIELRELNRLPEARKTLDLVCHQCSDIDTCNAALRNLKTLDREEKICCEIVESISSHSFKKDRSIDDCLKQLHKLRELRLFSNVEDAISSLDSQGISSSEIIALRHENKGDIFYYLKGDIDSALEEYTQALKSTNLKSHYSISVLSKYGNILLLRGQESIWEQKISTLLQKSDLWAELKSMIVADFPSINLKDYLILILTHSNVGDSTGFLSILKSISQQGSKKIILFLNDKPHLIDLYKLFEGDHIFKHYFINTGKYFKPEFVLQPIRPGIPSVLNLENKHVKVPKKTSTHYQNTDCHFDVYKRSIGLPSSAEIAYPNVKSSSKQEAILRFKSYNLSFGKTVLVAPLSNSMNSLYSTNSTLEQFWKDVFTWLNRHNYHVALNGINQGQISLMSKHQIVVEIPLAEVLEFVELSGFFIGARSGLCDLLGFSSCRKKVIYPIGHKGKGLASFGYEEYIVNPENYDVNLILSNWLIKA